MSKLRCAGTSIVFQEVPDEISLAFSISGCPYRCPDCHSKYLWNNQGELLEKTFYAAFHKYEEYITCVCFMEGSQNFDELKNYCEYARKHNKKVCLYTGRALDEDNEQFAYEYLDYLKVGRYLSEYGGLKSPSTNQRFYVVHNQSLIDETYKFQKEWYNEN